MEFRSVLHKPVEIMDNLHPAVRLGSALTITSYGMGVYQFATGNVSVGIVGAVLGTAFAAATVFAGYGRR